MIPYGRQDISQNDIDAVVEVLQSDFLTQGPKVPLFEDTVAKKVGAGNAIAVNSATSALHVACMALGLKEGDTLWTSPITFVASANCALYCGAHVDFVDIDPKTYNLCPKALELKLSEAEKNGCLPKILVVVHLSGQSCSMDSIYKLSLRYGFRIIEDASHAIGGRYKKKYIGSCCFSDVTIFSFHPVKIVTTAEGGMALTNNVSLADKMRLFRSHGVTRDERLMTQRSDGPWFYQQVDLGYNYRMTELQAALGLSQLKRLDEFVCQRNKLACRYDRLLASLPVTRPFIEEDSYSAFHLYIIRLNLQKIEKSHRQVFEELRERGVGVNLHYIPVHTQPYYRRFGYLENDFPNSMDYYSEAISLPIFHGMEKELQDKVVDALGDVLGVTGQK